MKIKKMQQLITKVTNANARDRMNSIENAFFSNKETSQTFKISFSAVSTNFWAIEIVLETARRPLHIPDAMPARSAQK